MVGTSTILRIQSLLCDGQFYPGIEVFIKTSHLHQQHSQWWKWVSKVQTFLWPDHLLYVALQKQSQPVTSKGLRSLSQPVYLLHSWWWISVPRVLLFLKVWSSSLCWTSETTSSLHPRGWGTNVILWFDYVLLQRTLENNTYSCSHSNSPPLHPSAQYKFDLDMLGNGLSKFMRESLEIQMG